MNINFEWFDIIKENIHVRCALNKIDLGFFLHKKYYVTFDICGNFMKKKSGKV